MMEDVAQGVQEAIIEDDIIYMQLIMQPPSFYKVANNILIVVTFPCLGMKVTKTLVYFVTLSWAG